MGGDSDVGIGVGQLSALAGLRNEIKPYLWRLESGAFITFKAAPNGGGLLIPYQDYYLVFTLPHVIPDRLRLEIRPSFTRETTQKFYGLGNASIAPRDLSGEALCYFEYGRTHPTLYAKARLKLGSNYYLQFGNSYTRNWIDVHPGSELAFQLNSGGELVRSYLGEVRPHSIDFFEGAFAYDSRDNETATHSGTLHELTFRFSPGGIHAMPYQYEQANLSLRFFVTPFRPYLTLGLRLVADFLFGTPPFYELARFDDTFAIGGSKGVRGVPAQRYYGKIKVFGNFETRSELLPFTVKEKRFVLGAVAFADVGRLWLDYRHLPELDGTGLGLKYGIGGGLRLQQGETFVIRADVAWSPDAQPISAYFEAGHLF